MKLNWEGIAFFCLVFFLLVAPRIATLTVWGVIGVAAAAIAVVIGVVVALRLLGLDD